MIGYCSSNGPPLHQWGHALLFSDSIMYTTILTLNLEEPKDQAFLVIMTESNRRFPCPLPTRSNLFTRYTFSLAQGCKSNQEEQSQNDFFFEKVTVQLPQQIICCLPQWHLIHKNDKCMCGICMYFSYNPYHMPPAPKSPEYQTESLITKAYRWNAESTVTNSDNLLKI